MPNYTDRLPLQLSEGEKRDVRVLDENFRKIAARMNVVWIEDNAQPAAGLLFDGALFRERGSGRMLTARSDGAGGFTLIPETGRKSVAFFGTANGIAPGGYRLFNNSNGVRGSNPFATSELEFDTSVNGAPRIILKKPGIWHYTIKHYVGAIPQGTAVKLSAVFDGGYSVWSRTQPIVTADEGSLTSWIPVTSNGGFAYLNPVGTNNSGLTLNTTVEFGLYRDDVA